MKDDILLTITQTLKADKVPLETINKVLRKITEAEAAAKAEKEPAPRQKNQFVPIIFDKEGKLAGNDFTAIIAQVELEAPASAALTRLKEGAKAYNESRKGSRKPVKSVAEVAEYVSRKFLKEARVLLKTKVPVQVITTDNTL